jgi:hypothetical protein
MRMHRLLHVETSDKSLCHGCVDACEDGSDERVLILNQDTDQSTCLFLIMPVISE